MGDRACWAGLCRAFSPYVLYGVGTWACGPGWYVSRLWRLVLVRGLRVVAGRGWLWDCVGGLREYGDSGPVVQNDGGCGVGSGFLKAERSFLSG